MQEPFLAMNIHKFRVDFTEFLYVCCRKRRILVVRLEKYLCCGRYALDVSLAELSECTRA